MPFTITDAIPAGLCCAAVIVLCPQRVVRVRPGSSSPPSPRSSSFHTAVGGNITRLAWVCAIPRGRLLTVAAPAARGDLVLAAIWPARDLMGS